MRSGLGTVENGFIAARRRIGSPVDMPPSIPPARAVAAADAGRSGTTISSCAFDPGRAAEANPSPTSTPFTDWIDISARRQPGVELAVPMHVRAEPGRHAVGEHLEHAAHAVPGLAGPVDLGDHRSRRAGVGAPDGRRVDRAARSPGRRAAPAAGPSRRPIRTTWDSTGRRAPRGTPCRSARRRPAPRSPARSPARGRCGRRRTRTSRPDQVGVARPGTGQRLATGRRRRRRPSAPRTSLELRRSGS